MLCGRGASGGSAGTATVLTTGTAFSLSTDEPIFTSAPAGGGTGVTFASNYASTGDNVIPQTSGATATPLSAGTSNISVNMSATKTSGTFVAGTYAASVTLRCE